MSYITPTSTAPLPGGLTLNQFIQTVLVGISGIAGTLVRPSWQINPPKQPDIDINWMAFGVNTITPDANSAITVSEAGVVTSQRQEGIEINLSIYGPDALEIAGIVRDGFQIPQNLEALTLAKMGFTEVSPARQVPDFFGERFFKRIQLSVFLRREVQRIYPIPTLISALGTIHTLVGGEEYTLDWETET